MGDGSVPGMAGTWPTYRSASGWSSLLPPWCAREADPGGRRFDAIVVGAGYTGLAAARRIAELRSDARILVVDASTVGDGASGRNAGVLVVVPHNLPAAAGGARPPQLDAYADGYRWLKGVVERHGIACDWTEGEKHYAAATPRGSLALERMTATYEWWGVAVRRLETAQLRSELGTGYYRSGFASSDTVLLQPAALVRGLATHLPDNVTLLENTAVLEVRGGKPTRVRTGRGTFEAPVVILANNGFVRRLGFLKSRLLTIVTYAGLTPRLPPADLASTGALPQWTVLPAHRLGTTLRRTGDGRLLVRSSYSYEREAAHAPVETLLRHYLEARFPDLAIPSLEYVWGGATALTRNGAAFVGQVAEGVYAAAGCNGSGILKGTVNGLFAAELALGAGLPGGPQKSVAGNPSWMPPEPGRKIAVETAIAWQTLQAGAER